MNRCEFRFAVVALVFLAVLAAPAAAQEHGVRKLEKYRSVSPYYEIPTLSTGFLSFTPETEMDLGFTRLHAFFGERILFDDNIFLADDNEDSDVIFQTTPGFLAQTFVNDHRIQVSYAPTLRNYADASGLDTWDHDANFDLRLDFVDAYARVADRLVKTQDARDINFEGKVDRSKNRLEAEVGGLVGDYGLGIRGQWQTRDYGSEIPSWEDLDEWRAGVFGRWVGLPDHAVLFEYEFLRRDFRGQVLNDSTSHTILTGLEGQPWEDLGYFLKLGVVSLHADHDAAVDDSGDLFDLAIEAEAHLQVMNDLQTSVFYVQRPEYASFSNFQKVYRGGASVSWAADPGWLDVRGNVYLEKANPSNEPCLTLFGVGVAADTNVTRWMKAGMGYEWRRRLGHGGLDYDVNQVYLQGVVYF